jgi:protoporphyrinogen oxidase
MLNMQTQGHKGKSQPMRIAIIGAGVAGLSAAWDLVNAEHEVHVYEAGDLPGGLAAGFKDDHWDWSMEKFYHHWFTSDAHLLKLTEELGVRDKVLFPRPITRFLINGQRYQSEMNLSIFSLPISPIAIFRMGFWGAFLKFAVRNGEFLEQYTAHEWMQLYMGKEAYRTFFLPLLIGKFGDQYDKVNMAWLWARIFTRSVRLGTYEGGFQAFMDEFSEAIFARGGRMHYSTRIEQITLDDDARPVLHINGETETFDRVISTASPRVMLKMLPTLNNTHYGDMLADLKSLGAIVVIVALKRQLLTDDTYWLNLEAVSPNKDENEFPFLALVEHTNFIAPENFNGDRLVYLGDYAPPEHPYFSMSDDEIIELFTASLPKFNSNFKPDWIRKVWVFRAPYAQPVPGVHHRQNIPDLKTPIPGVYWASMSQVYPYDRGTNFAVEIGRRVARTVMEDAD